MNLTLVFLAAVAAGIGTQFLDWANTAKEIAKSGLAGEKNPVMRFFFSKSKWAALAYKLGWTPFLIYAGLFHAGGDVQNYGAVYADGSGHDYWAITWIIAAIGVAGEGLYGWLKSKKN